MYFVACFAGQIQLLFSRQLFFLSYSSFQPLCLCLCLDQNCTMTSSSSALSGSAPSAAIRAGFRGAVQASTFAQLRAFSFLSIKDACMCERVCKAFKRSSSSPQVWSVLYHGARAEVEQQEFSEWEEGVAAELSGGVLEYEQGR